MVMITARVKKHGSGNGMRVSSGTANRLNFSVGPITPPSPPSPPFKVGVNVHRGGSTSAQNTSMVAIMSARNFKVARMDYNYGTDQTLPKDFINKVNSLSGGECHLILFNSYASDETIYTSPAQLASVYNDSYSQAYAAVSIMGAIVTTYEVYNEIPYRTNCQSQVAVGSGQLESAYTGKTAFISLAAAARGVANAIHDYGSATGIPRKVILGTVSRDWGFLRFMQTQGVNFDIVGFHCYSRNVDATVTTDPFFGTGGTMVKLAEFGLPVAWNEFNSADIYDADYDNVSGSAATERGLSAVAKHMSALYSQTTVAINTVCFYELLDEPDKNPVWEKHFGLMYDTNTPKVCLHLATAFAGGSMSAADQLTVTSRGLLNDATIAGMQRG
jgi:hypothetical protein